MIVELCLTVPLRLTHLLPHLSYLMKPLALALRGTLRTLELCIDNLTPDFLDPTLSIVLRELMEALFNHLKPAPQSHHLVHTTIRILGKLGGRNHRLLFKEPALTWHHSSDPAKMAISFNGNTKFISLAPISQLAGLKGKNVEDFFVQAVEGLFDCVHIPTVQNEAEGYIRKLATAIFENELRRNFETNPPKNRYQQSPLMAAFLDSIPHALSCEQPAQMDKQTKSELLLLLHHLANRFTTLCLDEPWIHKNAGCNSIRMVALAHEMGQKWIADRELDLIRTLLYYVLKDLLHDLPRNVDDVLNLLVEVLTISHSLLDLSGDNTNARTKLAHLAGMFFPELQSPNPIVRQAAQGCISYLVELSGHPAVELLMPHRDRMLGGVFTKRLRALPFLKQIGMIEAVRFCVSLDPPLVELNDELLRLLHETLALADADDAQLLGPRSLRQTTLEVVKLRVACIKLRLLTAAMPLTDYFSRQPQTRQRVTSVYVKSLYSHSQEVKDVAHDGLRLVLGHQSRLPKELLQKGLRVRPFLMNLADPKKLSISGLEGLARLLELLTNYFKLNCPSTLYGNRRHPKLVRLAHIFHLLPPAAGIFLENLFNAIVQTETVMCYSTRNPFSEPLAKYLDHFSVDGVKYLLENLKLPRLGGTYRNILEAHLAPNLERELTSNAQILGSKLAVGCRHYLFGRHDFIVGQLVALWNARVPPAQEAVDPVELNHWHSIIQDLFIKALQQSPRVDLLFELVLAYTRNLEVDTVTTTTFLYHRVALSEDVFFRRNVLVRFATWFGHEKYTWQHKRCFIRYVVTPTLLVQATRTSKNDRIIDTDFVAQLHRLVWLPLTTPGSPPGIDDAILIDSELLPLTITCDDVIQVVKRMGYLLAARFFCTFPTAPEFILRAWVGLLQFPRAEICASARYEALSVLAACLPNDVDESGDLVRAKETRHNLIADAPQALPIYHLIVKQQDLFLPVRALFIQHMTNSRQKFCFVGIVVA
ncbi:hypothetical protein NMY22_g3491 [Coprinellus aureogranulatus]|nr:hypothetical protein NMY22_g3491 [Coprinellus aureogranulatus]